MEARDAAVDQAYKMQYWHDPIRAQEHEIELGAVLAREKAKREALQQVIERMIER